MMKKKKVEVHRRKKKKGGVREYAEALITALLVAFVIRSFVIEAFKIPSGSMIPTLMIGDHIFVNKFIYGLRVPFTKKKIVTFGSPQRGESVVFMYPSDDSKDFIKRIIGLPGDRVQLRGDEILINSVAVERQPIQIEPGADGLLQDFMYYFEKLGDVNHLVQFDHRLPDENREWEVPEGQLFVMGDNRDNSSDSREWGFVPLENVKGKAMFIWLSLDYDAISEGPRNFSQWVRWNRFGKWIR